MSAIIRYIVAVLPLVAVTVAVATRTETLMLIVHAYLRLTLCNLALYSSGRIYVARRPLNNRSHALNMPLTYLRQHR
jgi:hypothetical protein